MYDTEASLPVSDVQPAAKHAKMCDDLNGNLIERRLKFSTIDQLPSYSFCTNVPGCADEFFACREGDSETDVKNLVEKFVAQLLSISEKSFIQMEATYHDVICELDQAIAAENVYNDAAGIKKSNSGIKDLKKKFITWLKQLPCVGFNSSNYDLNVLEKNLIPILLKTNENLSPIKRGNSFLALTTPELAFLDLKNHLATNY